MAAPKIELLSKKLTKPSSSTPDHLRTYKLSFLDQLQCLKYLPTTLFYENNSSNNANQPSSFEYIEQALADVLSFYYPYAGTLADNVSIDCNDMGVMFTEVRIQCSIFEFLKQPCPLDQNLLYCNEYLPWKDHGKEECLAAAQLSHFECGGKSISFCQTHKVGDATTLCHFLNGWAAMASPTSGVGGVDPLSAPPPLTGASLMPPDEDQVASDSYDRGIEPGIVSRRFRLVLNITGLN
ncbi:hypothetical protein LIER_11176 [Lithospermum erythrorhizon]|uniref:Uncharacterized protein n=1 Tax=Lithospermum erythrorhizon TaxID=34254 RepID=A0AAV3PM12_LITER